MTPRVAPLPDSKARFDVAIVGAGLAGSALALRLARPGVRVALLDANRFPRDKLCGEYLSPEGAEALERLGLERTIQESGFQPIRTVRISTPRGRILEAEVIDRDGRPGVALSRAVLDDLLIRTAKRAGAVLFEGCRVGNPIIEAGKVVGIQARHSTGETFALRAPITVAADGRHSTLVRRTGTTYVRSRFRPAHFGLKRHLTIEDDRAAEPPVTVGLHLISGGYVGTCRVEGGVTNLCGLLPEALSRRFRGNLDALADDGFRQNPVLDAQWQAAKAVGAWKTVARLRVECSTPHVSGIFYAGDCRGTIDPLGGQGMTMALLGAEVLAPFALNSLARNGDSDSAVLQSYESAWHRRFDHRIRLCRLFHQALIQHRLIDGISQLESRGSAFLAACYRSTRDYRS